MEYPKEYQNYETIIKPREDIAKQIMDSGMNKRETFFPELINRLNLSCGVEIGVDTGDFTYILLSKTKISLYGIDCWMDDFGSNFRPGFFDPIGQNRMDTAIERLKEFGSDNLAREKRITLIKNTSVEEAACFGDNLFDFVYIDGDHSFEGIYNDLYSWINKVRVGGIIAGDDFKDGINSGIKDYFGNQLPFRVQSIVTDFCKKYGFKLNTTKDRIPNWWFIKNR